MHIRNFFLTAVLFAGTGITAQQNIKDFVKNKKQLIRTVDPADTDFSDLEVIGNAIGDKRVVMMGEQDHGDAPAFLAKTRLIKYLHEKKGFNVIAFESDFFGLTEGQKEISNDTAAFRKYLQGNIFGIWTYCDACSDLFYQYLPGEMNRGKGLVVTGFDNQAHSRYSKRKLRNYLDSIITPDLLPAAEPSGMKKYIIEWTDTLIKNYGKRVGTPQQYDSAAKCLRLVMTNYAAKNGKDYGYYVLGSMEAFNLQNKYAQEKNFESITVRDAQMAANLDWLVNVKYKSGKVIVWAHNYHILNNSWAAMNRKAGRHFSMGNEYSKIPGNAAQTYILGFDSKFGRAGRINFDKKYKLKKPKNKSLENWMGDAAYAFVDFAAYNRQTAELEFFYMKGKYNRQNANAQWTRCFDGVFYIREMYPCRRLF
jgi:erythromycin esterase